MERRVEADGVAGAEVEVAGVLGLGRLDRAVGVHAGDADLLFVEVDRDGVLADVVEIRAAGDRGGEGAAGVRSFRARLGHGERPFRDRVHVAAEDLGFHVVQAGGEAGVVVRGRRRPVDVDEVAGRDRGRLEEAFDNDQRVAVADDGTVAGGDTVHGGRQGHDPPGLDGQRPGRQACRIEVPAAQVAGPFADRRDSVDGVLDG